MAQNNYQKSCFKEQFSKQAGIFIDTAIQSLYSADIIDKNRGNICSKKIPYS